MFLKKETEYALIGLIALNTEDYLKDVRKIAEENKLSYSLLAKIFQQLARAKIIESKIGPGGGFRVVKNVSELTLKEIADALQGGERLIKCYSGRAPYCKDNCSLLPVFKRLESEMDEILRNYTLEHFMMKENK